MKLQRAKTSTLFEAKISLRDGENFISIFQLIGSVSGPSIQSQAVKMLCHSTIAHECPL